MADETVKKNLRAVDDACTVDEKIQYLRDLIKGGTKDNLALFADGAFERAVQIAESEQKIENQELIEETRSEQPINEQEGCEPGD